MITVAESKEYSELRKIFTNPDVWSRIADDEDPEAFAVPQEMIYLLGKVNGLPAGVFVLHEARDGTDSHVQILPEFRRYKKDLGDMFLEKASEYVAYLTTDIPKNHPNVHAYALSNGYVVTGEDDFNWYYRKDL